MIRPVARQAALRLVLVLGAEKHEVLLRIRRILVPDKLEMLERAAQGVDLSYEEIGADPHRLTFGRRGSRRARHFSAGRRSCGRRSGAWSGLGGPGRRLGGRG